TPIRRENAGFCRQLAPAHHGMWGDGLGQGVLNRTLADKFRRRSLASESGRGEQVQVACKNRRFHAGLAFAAGDCLN
ncbi:MAG: hypothetical protein AAF663_06040, partial [Planctomycetota bacterium]